MNDQRGYACKDVVKCYGGWYQAVNVNNEEETKKKEKPNIKQDRQCGRYTRRKAFPCIAKAD